MKQTDPQPSQTIEQAMSLKEDMRKRGWVYSRQTRGWRHKQLNKGAFPWPTADAVRLTLESFGGNHHKPMNEPAHRMLRGET